MHLVIPPPPDTAWHRLLFYKSFALKDADEKRKGHTFVIATRRRFLLFFYKWYVEIYHYYDYDCEGTMTKLIPSDGDLVSICRGVKFPSATTIPLRHSDIAGALLTYECWADLNNLRMWSIA